jgi:hypothetical protein
MGWATGFDFDHRTCCANSIDSLKEETCIDRFLGVANNYNNKRIFDICSDGKS